MTNNKVLVNKRVKIDTAVFSDTTEMSLPTAQKILAVSAECRAVSSESLLGELRIGGKLAFTALYLDEDNKLCSSEKITDVSYSLSLSELAAGDKAILDMRVSEISYSGTVNLSIATQTELNGYFVTERALSFAECDDETVKLQQRDVRVETVGVLCGGSIRAAGSQEMKKPAQDILCHRCFAFVNNIFPTDGQYQLEGEVNVSVLSLADGEATLSSFTLPFTAEITDSSVTAEAEVAADVYVKSSSALLESEDGGRILLDVELGIQGTAVSAAEVKGICDAYCVENELIVTPCEYEIDSHVCYRKARERVSGTVEIFDGALKSVEAVCAPVIGSISATNDFGLYLEGVLSATVLYSTHENRFGSVSAEIPYRIAVAKDFDCDIALLPTLCLASCNAKIVSATEIELTFDLIASVRGVKTETVTLLENMEVGEGKENGDVAIALYIAQPNETLWSVAKALSVDEGTLLSQNPELKLPLNGGEKILFYRQI